MSVNPTIIHEVSYYFFILSLEIIFGTFGRTIIMLKYLSHREKLASLLFYLSVGFFLGTSIYRLIPAALKEKKLEQRTNLRSAWFTKTRMEAASNFAIEFRSTDSTLDKEWEFSNQNVPNLPLIFANRTRGPRYNRTCALFPNFYTVQYSNVHWQVQRTQAETYYFYSAYLDMRGNTSISPYPYRSSFIRILGMSDAVPIINEKNASLKTCQLWFEGNPKPVFTSIVQLRMLWVYYWGHSKDLHYYPYLISCKMPPRLTELPVSVSLVPKPCFNATNNLNILHRNRFTKSSERIIPKKNFGVCVKALSFRGIRMRNRLIEWIESLRALGAEKLFLYEYFVDSDIKKMLNYYERQGIVELQPTSLPGGLPNQPLLRHLFIQESQLDKRLTELVPYNDCMLKNMYDFKYLAVLDIDEIILPKEDIRWPELIQMVNDVDIGMDKIIKQPVTTYCFENFYYMDEMLTGKLEEVDDIPPNFHMLRHIYRSSKSNGRRFMKCFHSTEATLAVHNHFALFCANGRCNRHYVTVDRAQMNHYRYTCVTDVNNCSSFQHSLNRDTKLWRYRDKILQRGQAVLNYIDNNIT